MTSPAPGQAGAPEPGDDPEERDPGLARERTTLAWTRTAISFTALGGAVLKENVVTGLIILAVAPVVWQLGRLTRGPAPGAQLPAVRLFVITVSIVAVAVACLIVAVFGKSVPGALR